jgi:hypothetical protein
MIKKGAVIRPYAARPFLRTSNGPVMFATIGCGLKDEAFYRNAERDEY